MIESIVKYIWKSIEYYMEFYGYWIVFFGSLVEGESILLLASTFAVQGKLNIFWIIIIAFVGTLIADQTSFYYGHHYGQAFIQKRDWLKKRSDRVISLLHKYDVFFIIMMRFTYGIRVAGPIIVGASGLAPKRFIFWNIISAAIWSVLSCTAFYFFGGQILWIFENTEYLLFSLIGLCVIFWILHKGQKWLTEKFQ